MKTPRILATLLAMTAVVLSAAPALAQNVTVTPSQTYQSIQGFGGTNGAGWIADLTSAQVDLAAYQVSNGQTAFYVDPQSVATFISN